jgi:sugar O-acyltransferase (sialic acid O-acetyltransferase NeuD family)
MRLERAILGAGGFGRQAAWAIVEGLEAVAVEGVVFLDDGFRELGAEVDGLTVQGPIDPDEFKVGEGFLGVGMPATRARVVEKMRAAVAQWPAAIHRAAVMSSSAAIEEGTLVQARAVISTGVRLGAFSVVNLSASISHGSEVGRFAVVSPNAAVGGDVTIGEGAFIGIGATVIQGVQIGAWSVVGAGAVVTRNVEPNSVVVGVPAREIDRRPAGWHLG